MQRALKYPYRYSLRNFIVFGSIDCDFSGWKWNKCGTAEIYPFLNYNLALSGAPKFCAVGALKELLFSSAGWHSPLLYQPRQGYETILRWGENEHPYLGVIKTFSRRLVKKLLLRQSISLSRNSAYYYSFSNSAIHRRCTIFDCQLLGLSFVC